MSETNPTVCANSLAQFFLDELVKLKDMLGAASHRLLIIN